jgi:hypothetical protein
MLQLATIFWHMFDLVMDKLVYNIVLFHLLGRCQASNGLPTVRNPRRVVIDSFMLTTIIGLRDT